MFAVRTAQRGDVEQLLDMAAVEGWNPGLGDLDAFLAADPEGFVGGFLDGKLIAGVSVVRSGEDFAFLGLYLCAPAHRGKGYGIAVWNEGLRRVEGRTIGLDGVVAQQENYRKSGFVLVHRNIRYGGQVPISGADDPRIVNVAQSDFEKITAYDARHYGAPRPGFLAEWLRPGSGRTVRLLVTGDDIRGYGVIRPCREGFKIGPLFAETEGEAEALFRSLAATTGGAPLWIDPPEPNRAAVALAERYGLTPVFETARMYRGVAPALPLGNIYGITTFELG